ncbi:MAG: hypothetical protein ACPGMR_13420 [Pontibacterium sp.]
MSEADVTESGITEVMSDWESDAELSSANTAAIAAAFNVMGAKELTYTGRDKRLVLARFTRMVAAHPNNLSWHVRRILLAIQTGQRVALVSAIADVLWVVDVRRTSKAGLTIKKLCQRAEAVLPNKVNVLIRYVMQTGNRQMLMRLPLDNAVLVNGGFSTKL